MILNTKKKPTTGFTFPYIEPSTVEATASEEYAIIGLFIGFFRIIPRSENTAILASQPMVMIKRRTSSKRMVTSLAGVWATSISGERSIEKISRIRERRTLEKQITKNRTAIIPKRIMLFSCTITWYKSKTPTIIVTGNNNSNQVAFLS